MPEVTDWCNKFLWYTPRGTTGSGVGWQIFEGQKLLIGFEVGCLGLRGWCPVAVSLVNQTLFRSAGCIVDHQHAERGSGNSGRYSASPAGMSAEPMA